MTEMTHRHIRIEISLRRRKKSFDRDIAPLTAQHDDTDRVVLTQSTSPISHQYIIIIIIIFIVLLTFCWNSVAVINHARPFVALHCASRHTSFDSLMAERHSQKIYSNTNFRQRKRAQVRREQNVYTLNIYSIWISRLNGIPAHACLSIRTCGHVCLFDVCLVLYANGTAAKTKPNQR